MAFKLDDKTLPVDVAFTSNGINYPANWLRLTTLDEKKAIGITEVADPTPYDQRFYTDASTPKLLDDKTVDGYKYKGIRAYWLQLQKDTANNYLKKYDWYITRKAEKGTAIPTDITTYRDGIRTACTTRETEITNCADIPALKALIDGGITKWPDDPNRENLPT
tara:strand:- start:174 stop:665 length:492 start_codon:yes stop_codon:yes gene_type:complete